MNYEALKQGAGLFSELIRVCEMRGVPTKALARLASSKGMKTWEAIADLIAKDYLAEQQLKLSAQSNTPDLKSQGYHAFVDYEPFPSCAKLGDEFSGEASVSVILNGREFVKHASCADMNEVPGQRLFWLADPPSEVWECNDNEKVIAWGAEQFAFSSAFQRVRPATEKELRAFAKKHPDVQRHHPVAALGSTAMSSAMRYFAVLRGYQGRQFLVGEWTAKLTRNFRFLFVCDSFSNKQGA